MRMSPYITPTVSCAALQGVSLPFACLRAPYRTGARKPRGFSQGMHGLFPWRSWNSCATLGVGETAKLVGETRSPHKPYTGASWCEHLALLVIGRVPPECA